MLVENILDPSDFFVGQMPKNIIAYAYDGNLDGVKGQLAAGVSINFQDIVSYRYVSPVCLTVHPLTSFCLTYRMDGQLS